VFRRIRAGEPWVAKGSSVTTSPSPPLAASWPALMNAATAAQYLGERSKRTFLRRVGKVYPRRATRIVGRGDVWRKTDLDDCLASLGRGPSEVFKDIADVL